MKDDYDDNFVGCLEEINNSDTIDRNIQTECEQSQSMRNVQEKRETREKEAKEVIDHHEFVGQSF